jgi:hypothetical protein
MPLYEFEHITTLTEQQKSSIAIAITSFHSAAFNSPRFIVGTRFIDVSHGLLSETYIGGIAKKTNRLFVSLRSGTGRTPEVLESMTEKLREIWDTNVCHGIAESIEPELRAVYIMGTLDSAFESGFMLPMVSGLSKIVIFSANMI